MKTRDTSPDVHTWDAHRGPLRAHHAGVRVLQCVSCGFAHVLPLPRLEMLAAYYAMQFYQETWPDYLARYDADRPWWEMTHRHLCAALPWSRFPAVPCLLEVGAGPGIALDVAQQLGWETLAIEPAPFLAARLESRGHRAWAGTLEVMGAVPDPLPRRPDILYLYEVLEHQPDPPDFLRRCHTLLPPGGLLVLQVPNEWNALQVAAQQQLGLPPWWVHPTHLAYFTPQTLRALVAACGFTVLDMRGTFPMEQFLLMGRQYVGDDAVGRRCHQERMAYELAMDASGLWPQLEAQYRQQLGIREEPSIGREIVCIAQKGTSWAT